MPAELSPAKGKRKKTSLLPGLGSFSSPGRKKKEGPLLSLGFGCPLPGKGGKLLLFWNVKFLFRGEKKKKKDAAPSRDRVLPGPKRGKGKTRLPTLGDDRTSQFLPERKEARRLNPKQEKRPRRSSLLSRKKKKEEKRPAP